MTTHLTFGYRGYGQISETTLCRLLGGKLICDKIVFPKTLKQQFLAWQILLPILLYLPPNYVTRDDASIIPTSYVTETGVAYVKSKKQHERLQRREIHS